MTIIIVSSIFYISAHLRYKLKMSEYRGEQAEMNIQRLNVRIDQVAIVTIAAIVNFSLWASCHFHSCLNYS